MSQVVVDIKANRRATKWTRTEQIGRMLWTIALPLFKFSPRQLWSWRRFILRIFGANIGHDVHIYPTVKITIPWNVSIGDFSAVGEGAIIYALGRVTVGQRVTISQHAHLCAGSHDYMDAAMPLIKLPIQIGSDAWICADAFVGPGVAIGKRAIVGARAVAVKDVPDDAIVAGNPARLIKQRQPFE